MERCGRLIMFFNLLIFSPNSDMWSRSFSFWFSSGGGWSLCSAVDDGLARTCFSTVASSGDRATYGAHLKRSISASLLILVAISDVIAKDSTIAYTIPLCVRVCDSYHITLVCRLLTALCVVKVQVVAFGVHAFKHLKKKTDRNRVKHHYFREIYHLIYVPIYTYISIYIRICMWQQWRVLRLCSASFVHAPQRSFFSKWCYWLSSSNLLIWLWVSSWRK